MAKVLLVVETTGDRPVSAEDVRMHLRLGAGLDVHGPDYEVRVPAAEEVGELVAAVTFRQDDDAAKGEVTLTCSGNSVEFSLDGRPLGCFDLHPGVNGGPNKVVFDHPNETDEPVCCVTPAAGGRLLVAVNDTTADEQPTNHPDETVWAFSPED